jgi:hypothetical protein
MSRPKGSKNKEKEVIETITDIPVFHNAIGTQDLSTKEEPCYCETKTNPLMGYTLDEVKAFVAEVNPHCGRGGCLHLKEFHLMNHKGKLECHLCNCVEFL